MNIGWPEGIYLAIVFIGLGVTIARHGQTREYDALNALISTALGLSLLYWGGFFA